MYFCAEMSQTGIVFLEFRMNPEIKFKLFFSYFYI